MQCILIVLTYLTTHPYSPSLCIDLCGLSATSRIADGQRVTAIHPLVLSTLFIAIDHLAQFLKYYRIHLPDGSGKRLNSYARSYPGLEIKVSPYQNLKHLPLAIARYHMSHQFPATGTIKSPNDHRASWICNDNIISKCAVARVSQRFSKLPYRMNVQGVNGSRSSSNFGAQYHLANPYIGYQHDRY